MQDEHRTMWCDRVTKTSTPNNQNKKRKILSNWIDRKRTQTAWKNENMCESILANANERVPVLWIVFHTLIGHNILCVTFETECKWYVRQNRNSCPNKSDSNENLFVSFVLSAAFISRMPIYFAYYLSLGFIRCFWYRMLSEFLPNNTNKHYTEKLLIESVHSCIAHRLIQFRQRKKFSFVFFYSYKMSESGSERERIASFISTLCTNKGKHPMDG